MSTVKRIGCVWCRAIVELLEREKMDKFYRIWLTFEIHCFRFKPESSSLAVARSTDDHKSHEPCPPGHHCRQLTAHLGVSITSCWRSIFSLLYAYLVLCLCVNCSNNGITKLSTVVRRPANHSTSPLQPGQPGRSARFRPGNSRHSVGASRGKPRRRISHRYESEGQITSLFATYDIANENNHWCPFAVMACFSVVFCAVLVMTF